MHFLYQHATQPSILGGLHVLSMIHAPDVGCEARPSTADPLRLPETMLTNATMMQIWDAVDSKDVAQVREILARDPRQAVIQHPTTHLTAFATALRARADNKRQDRQLAQIVLLLLHEVTERNLLGASEASPNDALQGVPEHRHHRARIVMNLEKVVASSLG